MNYFPLLGFWWRHGQQIQALVAQHSAGSSTLLPDLLQANIAVAKVHAPAAFNPLLDDLSKTLREVFPVPPKE